LYAATLRATSSDRSSITRSYVGEFRSDPDGTNIRQRLYKLRVRGRDTAVNSAVDVPETFVQSNLQIKLATSVVIMQALSALTCRLLTVLNNFTKISSVMYIFIRIAVQGVSNC